MAKKYSVTQDPREFTRIGHYQAASYPDVTNETQSVVIYDTDLKSLVVWNPVTSEWDVQKIEIT